MSRSILLSAVVGLLLSAVDAADVMAWQAAGIRRFAVDVVKLKSGERLRGAIIGRDADGIVSMAVRSEWLRQQEPRMYGPLAERAANEAASGDQQLRKRIAAWIDEAPESRELLFFLNEELRRVDAAIAEVERGGPSLPEFLIVTFPALQAELLATQPAENRHVALLAWQQRLEAVETREVRDLRTELAGLNIALDQPDPDLSDRLPTAPQTDAEWAARRAIVEFHYGSPFEFQGMGSALVQTSPTGQQPPDLAALLPQLLPALLEQQLGGALGDLLNDPALGGRPQKAKPRSEVDLKPAIAAAQTAGVRGFRVTTLDLQPAGGLVTVQTRFVARIGDGKWQTVWQHSETANSAEADQDAVARIRRDPQISGALKLLEGLDAGIGGNLDTALAFGAATMSAQKKADQAFVWFVDGCLDRLDQPHMSVP